MPCKDERELEYVCMKIISIIIWSMDVRRMAMIFQK